MATLAGKLLDRRAFVPVLSLYGAQLTNCPLDQYYSDPAAYALGQAAVCEAFAPDVLCGPFAFALIGAAFGSELTIYADQAPNIRRPAIQSLAEWERLTLPDPDTHPRLLFFREAIRRMAAELQGQAPIAAVLPPPIDLPALIMGMEAWLDLVLFDRAGAERVLAKVTPFFVRLANCLFADGAAFVVLPSGFTSPAVLMREVVESFARPALDRALAQLSGPTVLHHVGAPLLAHLDLLTGMPSTVAFVLDQQDNLSKARHVIGLEPVLFGGPQGPSLARMTAAQVEMFCLAMLEERRLAKDPHFILCTSGPDVPLHTPPENIHAMRKAVATVGWGIV
jgi:uroporphyrinogen decarboxylase